MLPYPFNGVGRLPGGAIRRKRRLRKKFSKFLVAVMFHRMDYIRSLNRRQLRRLAQSMTGATLVFDGLTAVIKDASVRFDDLGDAVAYALSDCSPSPFINKRLPLEKYPPMPQPEL